MTTNDKTSRAQAETLSLEFDLPHSSEKVWRALTDPALLAQWLLPSLNFKLEGGNAFTFKSPPQPGWDGVVNCRMLEIETQRKIVYTWVVDDLDTIVTFTLAPTATGTRLTLVHSGFKPNQKQNFAGARYGWKIMGEKLGDLLTKIPDDHTQGR